MATLPNLTATIEANISGPAQDVRVRPNYLMPGSFLVRHSVDQHHADGSITPLWALCLPTPGGLYCCRCNSLACEHTKAADAFRDAGRQRLQGATS